jgi:hypothetical protein
MTRRERVGLQVVGVLAIAVAAWYYVTAGSGDVPTAAGRTPSNRVSARGGRGDAPLPVADVKLEQLPGGATERLEDPSRNPFRFKPKPAPPPPPVVQRPVAPQPTAPVRTGPPPPPPITLRMIGVLDAERPADRIAILSDPRSQGLGSPVYGKEGDIIEGQYRVLRVGTDSVELAYLDGRGRQTLRMSGQ